MKTDTETTNLALSQHGGASFTSLAIQTRLDK